MKQRKRRLFFELTAVALCFITCMLSVFSDIGIIKLPSFVIMKMSNTEDLLFSIFSVQAGIATVGIAIISIITGAINESHLGVSVTEYITTIKPAFLTHKRLIILSLLLVAASYAAMTFLMVNLCIVVLLVSILISIQLVSDVYIIFKGKKKLHKEIRDYIVERYTTERITTIKDEIVHAVAANNVLVMESSLSVIEDIFRKEVEKKEPDEAIIDIIIKSFSEVFESVIKLHDHMRTHMMIKSIVDLYSIANKNGKKVYPLKLWSHVQRKFFKALADLSDEQILEDFQYYLLHEELYQNLFAQGANETDRKGLVGYACCAYDALLLDTKKRNTSMQEKIKKELYQMSTVRLFYGEDKNDPIKSKTSVQEMSYLLKTAIDACDKETLEEHFFKERKYHEEDENYNLVYTIILIYLYYLAARETIECGAEVQVFARELLKRNKNIISFFYHEIDIVQIAEKNKEFIDGMLWTWEQMEEGEAKSVIINWAIDDFFVLAACLTCWNKERLAKVIEALAPNEMFSLYQRYFGNDSKVDIFCLLKEFSELFAEDHYSDEFLKERIEMFEDTCNERYRLLSIESGKTSSLSAEEMEAYAKHLRESLSHFASDTFSRFPLMKVSEEGVTLKEEKECRILNMKLPNSMIKEQRVYKTISDHLIERVMWLFLNKILPAVEFRDVQSDDRNKQISLIEKVAELKIQPTVVIGHRDTFWGEEDEKALQKFTEKLDHIKYPGGFNLYVILDGRKIEFSVSNIKVNYEVVPPEEILKHCKRDQDGNLCYNITNDIFIPFAENEVIEYVQNTQKIITVDVDIAYRITGEKIGAGFQIVPRQRKSNENK